MSRLQGKGPLALLAFDHRGEFSRATWGREPADLSSDEMNMLVAAKLLIAEAFQHATNDVRTSAVRHGILVDEQAGLGVLREHMSRDFILGLPVERADQDIFEFQYGDDFRSHIEAFQPDFVKALVRYNIDDEPDTRCTQLGRLSALSQWLVDAGVEFMFELVVRPSQLQLERVQSSVPGFEDAVRPAVIEACIKQIHDAGIHVDIWKLQGINDAPAATRVGELAMEGGARECVVLGGGAPAHRVDNWLRVAAQSPGFNGFVIGRNIWRDPLRAWLSGTQSRDETKLVIAAAYGDFVQRYQSYATN